MKHLMSIAEAELLLGLCGAYTKEDVTKAHHARAKQYHPDLQANSGLSKDEAEAKMVMLNEAKDILEEAVAKRWRTVDTGAPRAEAYKAAPAAAKEPEPAAAEESAAAEEPAAEKPAAAACEAKEEKTTARTAEAAPAAKKATSKPEDSLFYTILAHFPYFVLFAVAGWTLPFYVFGGLNIIPAWHGLITPTATDFLVFYFLVPFATLLNFIIPFHPIDRVLHGVSCGIYKAIHGAISDMKA